MQRGALGAWPAISSEGIRRESVFGAEGIERTSIVNEQRSGRKDVTRRRTGIGAIEMRRERMAASWAH